jgi:hypothetical protein
MALRRLCAQEKYGGTVTQCFPCPLLRGKETCSRCPACTRCEEVDKRMPAAYSEVKIQESGLQLHELGKGRITSLRRQSTIPSGCPSGRSGDPSHGPPPVPCTGWGLHRHAKTLRQMQTWLAMSDVRLYTPVMDLEETPLSAR